MFVAGALISEKRLPFSKTIRSAIPLASLNGSQLLNLYFVTSTHLPGRNACMVLSYIASQDTAGR